jgi:hypothetical protein
MDEEYLILSGSQKCPVNLNTSSGLAGSNLSDRFFAF